MNEITESPTLRYEVVQYHWVTFAVTMGIVLMLMWVLSYIPMWKSRKAEEEQASVRITGPKTFYIWLVSTIPWILLLTMLGMFLFGILYTIMKSFNPPNW